MTQTPPNALCSTDWLAGRLSQSRIRVLDGSFHVPGSGRDPHAEFLARRLPGAGFFDIDGVCDPTNPLPHMLPPPELFAQKAGELGIDNRTHVVVYDQPGSLAAPRVWWTFRAFGHDAVSVLDGGLGKWLAEGRPIESAPAAPKDPAQFTARWRPDLVRSAAQVLAALADPTIQIVDARPGRRYAGADPEPRPARHRGHVPRARSLPFSTFVDPERHFVWRSPEEIAAAFSRADVDPAQPVIAYCGSGVTACAVAFAARLVGHGGVAVYDGSWAEWGNRSDTPVER